jgi:mevalonate kinase
VIIVLEQSMAQRKEDPKFVIASAPGKVILFGEHAVVYPDRPAVASAIDLKTHVTVQEINSEEIVIILESFTQQSTFKLSQLSALSRTPDISAGESLQSVDD